MVSFIGFCKFCYTLTIDINDSLQVINDDVKTSNTKERMKWMNALAKIIQFHGDSQQLRPTFFFNFNFNFNIITIDHTVHLILI